MRVLLNASHIECIVAEENPRPKFEMANTAARISVCIATVNGIHTIPFKHTRQKDGGQVTGRVA